MVSYESTQPLTIIPFRPDDKDWIITAYDYRNLIGAKPKEITSEQKIFTEQIKMGVIKGWRINKENRFPMGGQPFAFRAAECRASRNPQWRDLPEQILAWKEAHQDPVYFLVEAYAEHTHVPPDIQREMAMIPRKDWEQVLYGITKGQPVPPTAGEDNIIPLPSSKKDRSVDNESPPPRRPPTIEATDNEQRKALEEIIHPMLTEAVLMIKKDFFRELEEIIANNSSKTDRARFIFLKQRVDSLESLIWSNHEFQ